MFKVLGFIAVAACVAGCQTPQPRTVAFNEAEYAPFKQAGTGSIKGQAFIPTRGGAVVRAAGREVLLNPVTTYSTEWYERMCVQHVELESPDSRAKEFGRRTVADADGNFEFTNLPPGDYYVASLIMWEWSANAAPTGGIAHAKVTVRDGQTTRAIVTR